MMWHKETSKYFIFDVLLCLGIINDSEHYDIAVTITNRIRKGVYRD